MPTRPGLPLAAVLISFLAGIPSPAQAQAGAAAAPTAAAPTDDQPLHWHIVRPGESLEKIALRLLGSVARWPEIWRLNPEIQNPHRITPGERVRVPPAEHGAPSATIQRMSHEVTERPAPIPWSPAQLGDTLIERDGVRTYAKSSAEMRFNDGTHLLVTEDSLVFLQRSARASAADERKTVEIVEGQADYEAKASGKPSADVEILLGPAHLTSRPDRGGAAQARARRPAGGGSKVMVYGGAGEVEAAGAKVMVPEGSGTSVSREGPPSPPEKLLAAPRLESPAAGTELGFANPVFLWEPVPAADGYVVELCRDAGCAALLDRRVLSAAAPRGAAPADGEAEGPAEGTWQPPAALPRGELFWRVTARSVSGLDGYPSPTSRLVVLSDRVDREPPAAHLTLDGPQITVGETHFASPSVRIAAAGEDAGCGLGRLVPTVDGRRLGAEPLAAGAHTASGSAVDRCGNRAVLAPLAFTVDAVPPVIHWQIGGGELFAAHGAKGAPLRPALRQHERSRRGRDAGPQAPGPRLDWTVDGRAWRQLVEPDAVRITSARPQIFIAPTGVALAAAGEPLAIGADQLLWIDVDDAGCGVDRLSFRLRPASSERPAAVEIEAVDLVGNASRLELTLATPAAAEGR